MFRVIPVSVVEAIAVISESKDYVCMSKEFFDNLIKTQKKPRKKKTEKGSVNNG